jgi:cell division protein FtsB
VEIPKVSKEFIKKVKREKSGRLKKTLYISIFVFIAVMFARGEYGLLKIYRLYNRINDAEKEIVRLKVESEDLKWEINKLKNDSTYIKLFAAEYYGYAMPDQTIIQFLPAAEDSSE